MPRAAVPRRGPQEILLEVREDRIPRRHGLGPRLAVLREVWQLLQRLLCACLNSFFQLLLKVGQLGLTLRFRTETLSFCAEKLSFCAGRCCLRLRQRPIDVGGLCAGPVRELLLKLLQIVVVVVRTDPRTRLRPPPPAGSQGAKPARTGASGRRRRPPRWGAPCACCRPSAAWLAKLACVYPKRLG